MNAEDIIAKLRGIMEESAEVEVDWSAVDADSTIANLGFDSLSVLDLTYDIQHGFDIDFEPEALASVKTVGELAAFISEKLGTK